MNYLDTGKLTTYWANTSSNSMIGKLIREGSPEVKTIMEDLLNGKVLRTQLDEQIIFSQLEYKRNAIWSLLLASGYLKVENYKLDPDKGKMEYELALTNKEVRLMFEDMIEDWFAGYTPAYNEFIKALLVGDLDAMNEYVNQVASETFSFFDTGKRASGKTEPGRLHAVKATTKGLTEPDPSVCFFHGFVLGLMVDLRGRYSISSNRESGFGRYDVVLEPLSRADDAIIIEFKVRNPRKEKTIEETVQNALQQIEDKKYETNLTARGIPAEKMRKYGFAFEGKTVLIG